MRVVLLTESPGQDETAAAFLEAAEAFNRGLDIRLRFLDVGFELRTIAVRPDEPAPAPELEDTISKFRPGVVLVLGGSPLVLECVAAAAKARCPVAYVAQGHADGSPGAIARIAEIVVFREGDRRPVARPSADTIALPADSPPGPALVDVLVRTVRERRSP